MVRHFQSFSFVVFLLLFATCQSPDKKTANIVILPSPQQFEIHGTSSLKQSDVLSYSLNQDINLAVLDQLTDLKQVSEGSKAQVSLILDPNQQIPEEGYVLNISDQMIDITASDRSGLLYGMMTLNQILRDARDQEVNLPLCEIKDYPLLKYRAIHLDVKHHMERKPYYYQLIDRLVNYKINGIIVELEDKLKYESQPLVGSPDGWTIDEWKELSDYAYERNIEISPLVQGLGHASFILKHEEYMPLRDDPDSDWAFNPLDPKTYEVQFDLYSEAIEATPFGKYLHIGGDEVHTTGRGSDKSPLELQLIWLNKVCQYAEEQGRTPIFWDDMPLKFAEVYRPMFNPEMGKQEVDSIWKVNEPRLLKFIDQFPKNCIYMRWNYQSPDTYGNLKAMEWFTSNGFQVMGATAGQTRWVLMPQNQSNIPNIRSFALSSIEKGLNGLLLTLWDDDSPHFELYMRGILAFSEYSWAGDKRDIETMKSAFIDRYFGQNLGEEQAFIDQLEGPVGQWKNILMEGGRRNDLVKNNLYGVIQLPDPTNPGMWSERHSERLALAREILQSTDSIAVMIDQAKQNALRNRYTLDVYDQVNELVKYTARMLITLEEYDQQLNMESKVSDEERKKKLNTLVSEFEAMRSAFEGVYGQTRILTKPDNYILDQDHHVHSANQTTTFDWQFIAEIAMLEQIKELIEKETLEL